MTAVFNPYRSWQDDADQVNNDDEDTYSDMEYTASMKIENVRYYGDRFIRIFMGDDTEGKAVVHEYSLTDAMEIARAIHKAALS